MRAAVGCRSLDATTMTTSTFQSCICRQTPTTNIHSYNRAPHTRLLLQIRSTTSTSSPSTHHIIHHGTKPSNQRAGTFPRSVKVGHLSSRSCRSGHSSYFSHSYLCLWRVAPDAKYPESARRRSIPQLLHTARAIRLGHVGRIPRFVSYLLPSSAPSKRLKIFEIQL